MEFNIKQLIKDLRIYHHILIWGISISLYYLMMWYFKNNLPEIPPLLKISSGFVALLVGFTLVLTWKNNWPKMMNEIRQHEAKRKSMKPIYEKNKLVFKEIKQSLKGYKDSNFASASFWHMETDQEIQINTYISKFDDHDREILQSVLSLLGLTYTFEKETIIISLKSHNDMVPR